MTHAARWPFPKSEIKMNGAKLHTQYKIDRLKPYFKYAMERWRVSDDARAIAWVNATHDYSRAFKIYRAIWRMDQLV